MSIVWKKVNEMEERVDRVEEQFWELNYEIESGRKKRWPKDICFHQKLKAARLNQHRTIVTVIWDIQDTVRGSWEGLRESYGFDNCTARTSTVFSSYITYSRRRRLPQPNCSVGITLWRTSPTTSVSCSAKNSKAKNRQTPNHHLLVDRISIKISKTILVRVAYITPVGITVIKEDLLALCSLVMIAHVKPTNKRPSHQEGRTSLTSTWGTSVRRKQTTRESFCDTSNKCSLNRKSPYKEHT